MNELYHHGVKGQKWGVLRSRTAVLYDKHPGHRAESPNSSAGNKYEGEEWKHTVRSAKGYAHRIEAANYGLNAKIHKKLGNETIASMNEAAKKESLKKAKDADLKKANNLSDKQAKWVKEAYNIQQEKDNARQVIKNKLSKTGGSESTRVKIKRRK